MPTSKFREFVSENTKWFTLVVFLVDVIVLIVVLGVLWAMPDHNMPVEDCGYLCLPCSNDPNIMCCGCRDEVLQDSMDKAFDEKYVVVSNQYKNKYNNMDISMHRGYIGDVKPVAHLIGDDRDMPSKDDKQKPVLPIKKWHRGNNCLLLNGMSLHSGRVRVPVSGFYHVYSAVDFNYQYLRNKQHDVTTLKVDSTYPCMQHAIFKSNIKQFPQKEVEVMSTHHPYEMSKNLIFSRYDTYIAGDVYLEEGDEVYVKVANISYALSPPKNVFGVHLI